MMCASGHRTKWFNNMRIVLMRVGGDGMFIMLGVRLGVRSGVSLESTFYSVAHSYTSFLLPQYSHWTLEVVHAGIF